MLYTPSFWYFQYVNRTTTAVTVAATVFTVEKTMYVTLWMDIVPMDVNNIGLNQSVMVGKIFTMKEKSRVWIN